jgi:uncharacterized protein (TIGR04255 family)
VAKHTQLSRPPLREALIDIQLAELLPISFAEGLKDQELTGYKYVNEIRQGQFALQFGPTVATQASVTQDELMGARYESADTSRVVQFRRNGFTYSILREYKNWDDLEYSAQGIWREFCKRTSNLEVHRLAVRYINFIEIPGGVDLDDYLEAAPRIPPELPQILANFFQRVVIPFSDIGGQAIVTQLTEPKPGANVSVVLDIDVQSQYKLAADSKEIWERFRIIRGIKDLIFFSYVTEKALEPFR